ncbi:MAG TPA: class E sortase [Acidimicrobiales bacterium]|nr:class E sortase [Acidimicrobiales bacterium]
MRRGHRALRRVALALVTVGVLLLAFVAYQLWGTALYEHNAQNQLRQELRGRLAAVSPAPRTTTPTSTPASGPAPTTSTTALTARVAATTGAPGAGTPIGLLTIPRIGMTDAAIVEGTDEHQLQQGPGHYTGTSLPGQAGNAAIAGHRTTYGAPFYNLNALQPGDLISIETQQGFFQYQVTTSRVVSPSDTTVLNQSSSPQLTLTTCNPRYSASQRLVVVAALHSGVLAASTATSTPSTTVPKPTGPKVKSLAGEGALATSGALSGRSTRGEVGEAVLWGALTALAAVLALVAWRRGRRPWSVVSLAMGTPLALGALLVCFQHVSLALPQTF